MLRARNKSSLYVAELLTLLPVVNWLYQDPGVSLSQELIFTCHKKCPSDKL